MLPSGRGERALVGKPMAGNDDTLRLAIGHHRAGRLADADRLYREILSTDPAHADALHGLGIVAAQAGKHEVGAQLILKAMSLHPERGEYNASVGNVLMARQKYAEASECYQRALFYSYFKELPPPFAHVLDHVLARLEGRTPPSPNP